MKWIASWSFVFFLATPFTSGAQSLEDRVRVLWDRSYSAPDSVLQEARQLLQEARAEGSYHAEVNALAAEVAARPAMPVAATKRHVNAVTSQMVGTTRAWSDADGLVGGLLDPECEAARLAYVKARGR